MLSQSYFESKYEQGRACGATPFELLMITYGKAILGCNKRDANLAISSIHLLMKKLNHESQKALSSALQKAYIACIQLIKNNKFDMAAGLLQTLRAAWLEANGQLGEQ